MQKNNRYDEEAERFLESLRNLPEQEDPAKPLDDAISEIDKKDTERHCSIVTTLVLAFIMILFGTALLSLTNKQDFTEGEKFSVKQLMSGKYTAQLEKRFDSSIPLRDQLHNAVKAVKFCYGADNKTHFIDIQKKLRSEDPYNVETYDNFVPIDESGQHDDNDMPAQTEAADEGEKAEGTTYSDDGKNKKLKTVTLPYSETTAKNDSSPDQGETTTTNNAAPGATTTTTIPPETTTTEETTETSAETSETSAEQTQDDSGVLPSEDTGEQDGDVQ